MMYKVYRNETTALLRIAVKQYYQEQLIENKNNLRKKPGLSSNKSQIKMRIPKFVMN